jgi:hypothetical protein
MKFWRMKRPEYDSDYRDSYVNGSLEHPFGLPCVKCEVCGNTWGGSRILPLDCPTAFRAHPQITKPGAIPRGEHEALQRALMASLAISGEPFVDLCPGDEFQPCFLDVPSTPRADFLWPSIGSFVVSARIKDTLVAACPEDIAACPVTLRRIGKREAKLPPPMPSTGEPEDIIDEVPLLKNTENIGPYFEIILRKESGYHPAGTRPIICPGCKRPDVISSPMRLRMTPEKWKGDSIFFLSTTLWVMVTEELRQRIAVHHPTNVVFEET